MRKDKIIYSLNIADIQTVAEECLKRDLNEEELKKVVDKMGDYINWADGISSAIDDLRLKGVEKDV
jgi:hypothetical protein